MPSPGTRPKINRLFLDVRSTHHCVEIFKVLGDGHAVALLRDVVAWADVERDRRHWSKTTQPDLHVTSDAIAAEFVPQSKHADWPC